MNFLYQISVFHLELVFKILSLFNDKIKRGVVGRKQSLSIVKEHFSQNDKIIWMHASSLGEYQQGLPVLEKLKNRFPNHKILVTFFSPSGYQNVVKKQHIADAICYLPFDRKSEIKEFVESFHCELFFTVKYDFWYNLLEELKEKGTKTFVVSALFYPGQIYFKPQGKWMVKQLKKNVDWIFHQTITSENAAREIGLTQSSTTGDTRFDRVKQQREQDHFVAFISDFKADKKLLIVGSCWEAEENAAKEIAVQSPETKIIIAPHELKRVGEILQKFPQAVLYSQLQDAEFNEPKMETKDAQFLIIDSIGLLSKIYSYGDLAIVGGGFHDKGLHNILEAATFGLPVFFGNQYKKNPEADEIIHQNGGKSFDNETDLATFVQKIVQEDPPKTLQEMSKNAKAFIDSQPNSSELILEKINTFYK